MPQLPQNLQDLARPMNAIAKLPYFSYNAGFYLGMLSAAFDMPEKDRRKFIVGNMLTPEAIAEPIRKHRLEETEEGVQRAVRRQILTCAVNAWTLTKEVVAIDDDFREEAFKARFDLALNIGDLERLLGYPVYFALPLSDAEKASYQGAASIASVEPSLFGHEGRTGFLICLSKITKEVAHLDLLVVVETPEKPSFQRISLTLPVSEGEVSIEAFRDSLLEVAKGKGVLITDVSCEELYSALIAFLSDVPEAIEMREHHPQIHFKKRRKAGGLVICTAEKVHVAVVGKQFGEQIRELRVRRASATPSDGTRTVRPHLRRGHWSHDGYGPRNSENRECRIRWLQPIFVHSTELVK